MSLSPFYRKTTNEFVTILIDPKNNFVADINGLNRKTEGAEFASTAGNFNRDGITAQLAYTYTYSSAKHLGAPLLSRRAPGTKERRRK